MLKISEAEAENRLFPFTDATGLELPELYGCFKCSMETTFKEKAIRLAVLSVGISVMFIASFASPTHLGLANAQQNKTLMQYLVINPPPPLLIFFSILRREMVLPQAM